MVLFIVDCTPYGPDRMAFQESCVGDDRLETDLLPFPVDMQRDDLSGQCSYVFRCDTTMPRRNLARIHISVGSAAMSSGVTLSPYIRGRPRWEVRAGGSRNSAVSLRTWCYVFRYLRRTRGFYPMVR